MMLAGFLFVALATAGAPGEVQPVEPQETTKTASSETPAADKVICRRIQKIGSLISRTKVCMTAREWELQSQANQNEWGAGKPGASSGN